MMEYGMLSSRKKGWKTVISLRGAKPKPSEDKQKASVSQVVMVSGAVKDTSVFPDSLNQQNNRETFSELEKHTYITQISQRKIAWEDDQHVVDSPLIVVTGTSNIMGNSEIVSSICCVLEISESQKLKKNHKNTKEGYMLLKKLHNNPDNISHAKLRA